MAAPKKDETQGTEATGDASGFAGRFPLRSIDPFAGGGTPGEEIDLDEEELAKKAGLDKGDTSSESPKSPPKVKKKRFGFG